MKKVFLAFVLLTAAIACQNESAVQPESGSLQKEERVLELTLDPASLKSDTTAGLFGLQRYLKMHPYPAAVEKVPNSNARTNACSTLWDVMAVQPSPNINVPPYSYSGNTISGKGWALQNKGIYGGSTVFGTYVGGTTDTGNQVDVAYVNGNPILACYGGGILGTIYVGSTSDINLLKQSQGLGTNWLSSNGYYARTGVKVEVLYVNSSGVFSSYMSFIYDIQTKRNYDIVRIFVGTKC